MCNCDKLIEAIEEGGSKLDRYFKLILEGKDECSLLKAAHYAYSHYCYHCKQLVSFEDLLHEALLEMYRSVLRGNQPRQNCQAYFIQICKFICIKWSNKFADPKVEVEENQTFKEKSTPLVEDSFPEDKESASTQSNKGKSTEQSESNRWSIEDLIQLMKLVPELEAATIKCLNNLGEKCRLLLSLRFFNSPPLSDKKELAVQMNKADYKVSHTVIAAEITTCKAKLRDCLKIQLKDYHDDYYTN